MLRGLTFLFGMICLMMFQALPGQGISCPPGQVAIEVIIVPDQYPGETTWELVDQTNSIVLATGDYTGDTVCVDTGICIRFTIYDSYGDGICCAWGNGSYTVVYDGQTVATGGQFGSSESFEMGCPPFSSHLPVVVINTGGQEIVDDPRIICDMKIIYNGQGNYNHPIDPGNDYNGKVSIEIRGSSSQGFPKKSYSFETQDIFGNNNNVSLLGLPVENDWVLYAPYTDKTFMRNILIYELGRLTGHWAPRTNLCELFVNEEYRGIYVLTEKIKQDQNRVDISYLAPWDTTGDQLTGGYIFQVDRDPMDSLRAWYSSFPPSNDPFADIVFNYVDPEGYELHPSQREYIGKYVDSFEVVLNGPGFSDPVSGFRKYADQESFIDYFLIQELARNVDGYRLSTYLYKEKDSNGGKIHAGPLWDFNIALGNADYCNGGNTGGWAYNFNLACTHPQNVPFWWSRMLQDTDYRNDVQCRWQDLRSGPLALANIYAKIDSLYSLIDSAAIRNFNRWPILGTYVWPNNYVGNTWLDEIQYLKSWIATRLSWMDTYMPGNCIVAVENEIEGNSVEAWPNPFVSGINFEVRTEKGENLCIVIHDVLGSQVREISNGEMTMEKTFFYWDGRKGNGKEVPGGVYIYSVKVDGRVTQSGKLIKSQ